MSDEDRLWEAQVAAFEAACRRRMRRDGAIHAECAIRRYVIEGTRVEVHCEHASEDEERVVRVFG
jgi:hypothetical protein